MCMRSLLLSIMAFVDLPWIGDAAHFRGFMNEHVGCDHQDFEKGPFGLLDALDGHDSEALYGGVGPEKRLVWHGFVHDQ